MSVILFLYLSLTNWFDSTRLIIKKLSVYVPHLPHLPPPLKPVDIATLFETMGFGRCIPKVLESPIDGPTLGLLGDDDFKQMGLDLPAQRR